MSNAVPLAGDVLLSLDSAPSSPDVDSNDNNNVAINSASTHQIEIDARGSGSGW